LKPDNILIKTDGSPVIIDPAIAREAEQPGVTLSGLPFGPCTPRYASPEQVLNRKNDITFKSDVFALGAIAYELFTGESPFDAGKDDLNDVFDRILNYDPPPLHELSHASHGTSALIGEMLQKEPYRRPRRPDQFIAKLDETIRNVS
jgi:serine/threonine protein kinase